MRMYCSQAGEIHKLFERNKPDQSNGARRMQNAGLVWDRYLALWTPDGEPPALLDGSERREVLVQFTRDYACGEPPPGSAWLDVVHARQRRVLEGWAGGGHGEECQLALGSRLAVGLGGPHPIEIGFLFDRSVGVPYLPGSSLKGLARAAARLHDDALAPLIETLFGPDRIDRDENAKTGDLVFLDAYPATWPKLEIDIINCHHPRYYMGGAKFPSETEDPVPVYFLTVAAGTGWIFRLISRSGQHAARGRELLQVGLTTLGAGAKTAAGYGYFEKTGTGSPGGK